MKEGWTEATLSEVCEKITDGTHQTPKYFDEGVVFLSSKNVTSGKIDWSKVKYIDEAQHIKMHKRVAPQIGDILLAKNGTTGVAAMVDRDTTFDIYVSLAHIRSLGNVSPNYMLHYINSPLAKEQFNRRLKGVGVPNLHLKEIREVKIVFPNSLAEQEAIVEVLDKAFAAIDQAKANLEQNIANAKELFQSKLNQIFSQKGEGWVEGKLGEYCDLSRGHNPPKNKFISEPKEGYVRFWQIRDGWSEAHKVYVPQSPQLHTVEPEDFLMVAYRHIGKVFRGAKGAFNVALCKIKNVRQDLLLDDYLFHMIPSDVIRGELLKRSERSLIPSMSIKHLEIIEIPVPPLDEQRLLIQQLDSLTSETKEIEFHYQTKLASLDELKKSILQKAFAGELT